MLSFLEVGKKSKLYENSSALNKRRSVHLNFHKGEATKTYFTDMIYFIAFWQSCRIHGNIRITCNLSG